MKKSAIFNPGKQGLKKCLMAEWRQEENSRKSVATTLHLNQKQVDAYLKQRKGKKEPVHNAVQEVFVPKKIFEAVEASDMGVLYTSDTKYEMIQAERQQNKGADPLETGKGKLSPHEHSWDD